MYKVLDKILIFLDEKVIWVNELVEPDKEYIEYLNQPLAAVDKFLGSCLQRPKNISDTDWNNHLFNIYGVCFEMYAMSTKGSLTLLDAFEPFALNYWKKLLNKDAIKRNCKMCSKEFYITSERAKWFKDKNQTLPKRCEDCLKARNENAIGNSSTNFSFSTRTRTKTRTRTSTSTSTGTSNTRIIEKE